MAASIPPDSLYFVSQTYSTRKQLLLMTLLLIVAWGRVWAGIPQTVAHDHAHAGDRLAVLDHCGSNMRLSLHTNQQDWVATAPHANQATDTATSSENHHHHLHLCSMGGHALSHAPELPLLALTPAWYVAPTPLNVIRRHEQLLRPPQG